MGFTKEQQQVIDARDCNLLVSAAAGSGKTTVLVERIIQRITGDKPIDIDRLLVVTFTKAAAAQMKERILDAIQKRLLSEPDNAHLQRQETLVHGAQITTIDSFCQYVIRSNFNEIGLDPSYRVGDEGEMKLIRADVMEELLEDRYAEADEDFLRCTEYFATGNNDSKLEEFIQQLYDYAMSMPFPEDWLSERMLDYTVTEEEFDDTFFVKDCMKKAKTVLAECRDRLSMALHISNEPDGPYFYGDLLEKELEVVSGILDADKLSYDEMRAHILNISFDRLPSKKDSSVNVDKRELAKNHRDYVKKQISGLAGSYFTEDSKTIIAHMALVANPVKVLAGLAIEFKNRFDERKREKGIIDFGDMEHLALQILVHKTEDGGYEPTNTAIQYRDFYEEVMIDEYQDSNNVQEILLASVSRVDKEHFNRFMVGDVKQSIYKFRLARPEIFMEKMNSYSSGEAAPERKISLHANFRSRKPVLDCVNYIFEQIMGEDLGGVRYDEDAALVAGADYYPEPEDSRMFVPEMLFANLEDRKSSEGRELEAALVAGRIKELMQTGRVTDKNGDFRAVRYSDIVILLRATSGWDTTFRKVLEDQGIPVYVESRTGYFSATEVVTVLNLLSIISNPLQDIPLVSVMHSAIGDFSDEELAIIRAHDKYTDKDALAGNSFYEILSRADKDVLDGNELQEELAQKIRNFIQFISDYRQKSSYLPVSELIKDIFRTTGFYEYCAALPGGEKRCANLSMLVEKALDYEKTSFRGVFHFVRYIEQLSKYQVDYGEAGILDENADVVRIMSIHKSKGLEFPIVFVSGISKAFNYMDTKDAVICDMDLGIGTHAIDLDRRIRYKTLRKTVMDERMKMDILGEEMRILYVAMTRAKEKLILTGQIKVGEGEDKVSGDTRKKLQDILRFRGREPIEGEQPYLLPLFQRGSAMSYQELIFMALVNHPDFKIFADAIDLEVENIVSDEKTVPVIFKVLSPSELIASELDKDEKSLLRLKELDGVMQTADREKKAYYDDRFSYVYPYSAYNKLFVKTTVSELKKAQLEEDIEPSARLIKDEEDIPGFVTSTPDKATGAARGTIYHKIMELIYEDSKDYDRRVADIDAFIKDEEEKGRLPEGASLSVESADIKKFCECPAGCRMKEAMSASLLYRESPFMMGVPASGIDKDLPDEELVLIQGIIDVWFEEDDGIVLLDYKTDKVKEPEELVKKYKVQLDYYQEALEKITDKKVKERLIYSFTLGKTINI
ncbi:MAG: helicase-exonuclease AddAB subunit AddA [Butyrivibrio sp.]|uniref:helicase-exonuclease AddAB subunit AddA n=1 Tax=Butyrivibrio sp. TaxID=28121 RepID=UPI0025FA089D|nr:helicase-exonuclease AddAB subunit AddA [Butyrivibrio sp.]MCR5772219.1 helicase-exonuclease AddAB subunit AddA [Butyrivibrio sp.]